MSVKPRVDCRFIGMIACGHPARRRAWWNPLSWVGLRRPACLEVLEPVTVCPVREARVTHRPPPGRFRPATGPLAR